MNFPAHSRCRSEVPNRGRSHRLRLEVFVDRLAVGDWLLGAVFASSLLEPSLFIPDATLRTWEIAGSEGPSGSQQETHQARLSTQETNRSSALLPFHFPFRDEETESH